MNTIIPHSQPTHHSSVKPRRFNFLVSTTPAPLTEGGGNCQGEGDGSHCCDATLVLTGCPSLFMGSLSQHWVSVPDCLPIYGVPITTPAEPCLSLPCFVFRNKCTNMDTLYNNHAFDKAIFSIAKACYQVITCGPPHTT